MECQTIAPQLIQTACYGSRNQWPGGLSYHAWETRRDVSRFRPLLGRHWISVSCSASLYPFGDYVARRNGGTGNSISSAATTRPKTVRLGWKLTRTQRFIDRAITHDITGRGALELRATPTPSSLGMSCMSAAPRRLARISSVFSFLSKIPPSAKHPPEARALQ